MTGESSMTRREVLKRGAAGTVGLVPLAAAGAVSDSVFVVKPYLQIGDAAALLAREQLEVLWHTADQEANWRVEQREPGGNWRESAAPCSTRIAVESIPPHRVWKAKLADLTPGELVEYRLWHEDVVVFAAQGRARRPRDSGYRCVVMGDCGTGSAPQKQVAFQVGRRRPDFVMIPGDIVYNNGRISEYRPAFFPAYSPEVASPAEGAPLLRSTLFLAGLGQHDTESNLTTQPDGFAYYYYWSQPLNGPAVKPGGPHAYPLQGTAAQQQAFLAAADGRYPRMATFSFDYGNTHWTVLDTFNPRADWNAPELRAWLKNDLAQARAARWRFVCSYLPPFSSCQQYPQGQKMRAVVDLLEEAGVDIVFSGYAHSYQRTYPLRFTPEKPIAGPVQDSGHLIPGEFTLDRSFDGREQTRRQGVLYIVTGGGGHPGLHSPAQTDNPSTWQPFTVKYHASLNQFTLLEVDHDSVHFRQISLDGETLDEFRVTK